MRKNLQKGLVPILLLLVVVFTAGGFYLLGKDKLQAAVNRFFTFYPSAPIITATPAPEYKTFTSNELGITFRYPANYEQYLKVNGPVVYMDCGCEFFDWFQIETVGSFLSPSIWWQQNGSKVFNGKVGINEKYHDRAKTISRVETVKMGDNIFVRVIAQDRASFPSTNPATRLVTDFNVYLISYKGKMVVITMYPNGSEQDEQFNQILSTFKFTK